MINSFKNIICSSSGKVFARIIITVLGVFILLSLAIWALILFGHFMQINPFIVLGEKISDTVTTVRENISTAIEERRAAREAENEDDEDDDKGDASVSGTNGLQTGVDTEDNPGAGPPYHGTPRPGTGQPETGSIAENHPNIIKKLDTIAKEYNCAAVSLAVFDAKTHRLYTYEYGYADAAAGRVNNTDTKFRVASLSKLITAMCVMTLVDDGYIDLDDDVSKYFGYELRNPHFPDTPVTARMLMQHTSSLFDSGAFQMSRDSGSSESVKYLIEQGASFRRSRPGSGFEYSDFGFAVLGSLCERVSGKLIDAYARDALFSPLGIDAAYVPSYLDDTENIGVIYDNAHDVSRSVSSQLAVGQSGTLGHDLHIAQGNLTISAADYVKILSVLGNGGVYGDVRVLSDSSVAEINNADVEGSGYLQGLATRYNDNPVDVSAGGSSGPSVLDDGFYWHTGSAYGMYSQYIYLPDANRAVVVITTGAAVNRLSNGMLDICTDLSTAALEIFG